MSVRTGDCLLSVDDIDLVGLRVADVATLIRRQDGNDYINIAVWRCPPQEKAQDDVGLALKGPLPDVAKNLVSALSGMVRPHLNRRLFNTLTATEFSRKSYRGAISFIINSSH